MVETETASFWYESPEVKRGELKTEEIGTEVFLLPAAGHAEKAGTFTNTQRLLQWRQKAVEPPDDARSENWFMYHLGRRLKEKAKNDTSPRNAGLRALTWDYRTEGKVMEPVPEEILKEMNGWKTGTKELVSGFTDLKADGSTTCGCWIYSGVFPKEGQNRANRARVERFLWARVGMGVAVGSARDLQPGVGEAGWNTVERAEEIGLVGRGAEKVDGE